MNFASSTVGSTHQDLSTIVDINAEIESDKRLQRIGWVNEVIEIPHRGAVPQEGVSVEFEVRLSVARVTCPESLISKPILDAPPRVPRSSIVVPSHRKA